MITLESFWKGRDTEYANELTDEIRTNASLTVEKANEFLAVAQRSDITTVNSGWRPKSVNDATRNSAKASKHLLGLAVDLPDTDGTLAEWMMDNVDVLKDLELWAEHPGWTHGKENWVHLQTVPAGNPPKPQVRIFIPSNNPATTKRFGTTPVIL
jgi:hypothetical protein